MRIQVQTLPNFETLVDVYYRPLFRFAVSLCGDIEAALKLTQCTLLKALTRPEVLRENGKIRPWLFTILFSEFLKRRDPSQTEWEVCRPKLTQMPPIRHLGLQRFAA